MKKVNFVLAICCLVAALSLQFKKADYVVSADAVETYSKAFAPSKKPNAQWACCAGVPTMPPLPEVGYGQDCMTGNKSCEDIPCPKGSWRCWDALVAGGGDK